MPWWFWVITHLWVICSTVLTVCFIYEGNLESLETWWEWVLLILIFVFAPITLLLVFVSHAWDEKIPDSWKKKIPMKMIKKMFKWFKERHQKKKDLKECEEKEDEWNIERMGTRSR